MYSICTVTALDLHLGRAPSKLETTQARFEDSQLISYGIPSPVDPRQDGCQLAARTILDMGFLQ